VAYLRALVADIAEDCSATEVIRHAVEYDGHAVGGTNESPVSRLGERRRTVTSPASR
jgi:hypothetical protein